MLFLLMLIFCKIVALFTGVILLKHLTLPYRLILIQVFIALAIEVTGYYMSIGQVKNGWIFNLYLLPELWLFGLAGRYFYRKNYLLVNVPIMLLVGTACLIIDVYFNGINNLAHWAILSIGIILILIYLNALIGNSLFTDNIFSQPIFWISIATILYYACIIPSFGLYQYLADSHPNILKKLYNIVFIFNNVRYIFIAVGFYLFAKQFKSGKLSA
ncbi:MAG: hypothetical protein EOP56_05070 [Sphingobacteriales bacterium]|nr:MAG: hypothetical protein EOP56_05070 [Sphingobacteriales bacterium]